MVVHVAGRRTAGGGCWEVFPIATASKGPSGGTDSMFIDSH